MTGSGGDYISGNITGDVSGQVAVGQNIAQTQQVGGPARLDDAERVALQNLFAELKARVAAEVPDDQRTPALERVGEFEEALTAAQPDLGTAQYVKRWFLRKLPTLAGLITGVLVNPVVGKLVQSAGDIAAAELARVIEE